jgi:phenylacetate-CoA ligase
MHQILFSGYHMSPENLGSYIQELRRRKPPWLHGYPSLLALLAVYLVDRRLDLGYTVRWVTTGAENLLRHQADVIERAFGVRPKQHYGLAEGVANFSECEAGCLHVDEDFAAVEFVPDERSGSHRIVGTNFTNRAMPFLRYDTGDLATLAESPCRCGRPGRVVASVDGRLEDYVVLPNGSLLGRLDHVFKDLVNVREAQIVQRAHGGLEVCVVPRPGYSAPDEEKLLAELRARVGPDIPVRITLVEALQRGHTGKLRFVISEMPAAKIVTRHEPPPERVAT